MCNKQLDLYGQKEITASQLSEQLSTDTKGVLGLVSEGLKESFETYDIPFLGCDFNAVYPAVLAVIPQEQITFEEFDSNTAVMCEIICAAICHQINWDFLREAVLNQTRKQPDWLTPQELINVAESEVQNILGHYKKKENIKAAERTEMLHSVGRWAITYCQIIDAFIDGNRTLLPMNRIKASLKNCEVFRTDPEEKKMNLLLQKLDLIPSLYGIGQYAKPAIDYHLLRLYLRRGLLYARTKYAYDYITSPEVSRKERTVAALRELCSKLLGQISLYTGLSITEVNLVEWHVARSVCDREKPDCELQGKESQWLKPRFKVCPFCHTCTAWNHSANSLLTVKEPLYKGTSY